MGDRPTPERIEQIRDYAEWRSRHTNSLPPPCMIEVEEAAAMLDLLAEIEALRTELDEAASRFSELSAVAFASDAELASLRTALARVEGERVKAIEERNRARFARERAEASEVAALSDCRILLAEIEWHRTIRGDRETKSMAKAWMVMRLNAAMAATDASGARTRHATKGGGA